jgi:polyketide biosynthesis acyl carrier protein
MSMTDREVADRERIVLVVRAAVEQILPGLPAGAFAEDRHLKDLGADSVDRVEIILGVLDRLGIDEPMSTFATVANLGALVDLLLAKRLAAQRAAARGKDG